MKHGRHRKIPVFVARLPDGRAFAHACTMGDKEVVLVSREVFNRALAAAKACLRENVARIRRDVRAEFEGPTG